MSQEEKNVPVEQQRLEKEQIEDMGSVYRTRGAHAIHCLTVIGQVEGHVEAPQGQKTTKYEHVIPQLVAVQEDPAIEGLLVLLNTVGGDVEAGLALAELIASISKPSAAVVLGGGHSNFMPLLEADTEFAAKWLHRHPAGRQRPAELHRAYRHHDGPPRPPFRHDTGRAPDHALVRADAGADHRLRGVPQRHLGEALY